MVTHNPMTMMKSAFYSRALFNLYCIDPSQNHSRRKSVESTKKDSAISAIGLYDMLIQTLINGSQITQIPAQLMFQQMVVENENGFQTSFYKASEQDTGDGRLALQTLAEILNGRVDEDGKVYFGFLYNDKEVEELTNDPELFHKVHGALHLLRDSFVKELDLNNAGREMLQYLYEMSTSSMVEFEDKQQISGSDYFIFAQFIANFQIMVSLLWDLYLSIVDKRAPSTMDVNFEDQDILVKAIHSLIPYYVEDISKLNEYVDRYSENDFSDGEFHIDTQFLQESLDFYNDGIGTGDLTHAGILASFSLSYDPKTNDLAFIDKDPESVYKELFAKLMQITLDRIGSEEDN